MAWRQCIFASILATASWSGAPAAIFDNDDRVRVGFFHGSPFLPIGRVGSGLRWGTGFLISDCHVLTVRHIISGRKPPLGRSVTFRVAAPAGYARSKGVVIASGELSDETRDRSDDWALIELDHCLGRTVGYFDIKSDLALSAHYATGPVRIAGFPRDGTTMLVVDPDCRIHHGTSVEWFNDCATLQGNSGSPVFRQVSLGDRQELRVLGMQTSGFNSTVVRAYAPHVANRATRIEVLATAVAPHLTRTATK